ncbi:hypothetical protein AN958_07691 [Leucoagaricus sp. SymC.cos]|nr:hypothetical protein AN958_07691 [Leucoagaricus sp. SymC.cos]
MQKSQVQYSAEWRNPYGHPSVPTTARRPSSTLSRTKQSAACYPQDLNPEGLRSWSWRLLCGFDSLPFGNRLTLGLDTRLITPEVDEYIRAAIREWNITGLAVGIVPQDPESATGWTFVHGFQVSGQDSRCDLEGVKKEAVPYFIRPENEGAATRSGGVIASARDAATRVSTLLVLRRHPDVDEEVIPVGVVKHVATGVSVTTGAGLFPETEVVGYGGSNIGFTSAIAPLTHRQPGIVLLNNDWIARNALNAIKWRLVDEIVVKGAIPDSHVIDWISRYKEMKTHDIEGTATFTPRATNTTLPTLPFSELDIVHTNIQHMS